MKRYLFALAVSLSVICFPLVDTTTAQSPPSNGPAPYLWDTHNHLVGRYPGSRGDEEVDYDGAAKAAMAEMKRIGIQRLLILPPPMPPDFRHKYDADDLVDVVRKHPGQFSFLAGGGSLNIMIQQAVRDGKVSQALKGQFEKEALVILSKGAVGFGEMTAEHLALGPGHPYESAQPDHPLFLLLSDIAARHGVPVDLHMEAVPEDMPLPEVRRLSSPPNPKTLRANIPAFERLLSHNRNTKILWDHVGWCNTGRRTSRLCTELLGRHPNLYMSFKIGPDSLPENRPLAEGRAVKPEWIELLRAYPDRFVIGTDMFYTAPGARHRPGPRTTQGIELLISLLPQDLLQKVAYENAVRIFGRGK